MIEPAALLPDTAVPPPPDLRVALRHWFGFDDFRPGQEEVVRAVMSGQDTLALMPTGAGKSLCYQLPAMLLPGITLVISPLIALMKDQFDNLPKPVYERSTFINSSLEIAELERRMGDVLAGRIKLIYAAPERLRQQPFAHALARAGLGLLVIDEAHCVSLWGHDFRPDYLFIGKALDVLGTPRVLGMTATATVRVQQEIGTHLGRTLHTVQTSPFRPNLFYQVLQLKHQREKVEALVRFCRDRKGSGIVYVRARKQAETLATQLRYNGVKAEHYHAGLESGERSAVQERWMLDKTRVIVATIAFGMGIDKSNVRFIVHFSPPDSLESYAQESGRAGRDGRDSVCLMLTTAGDRANLTRWLREESFDRDRLRAIYAAAQAQVRMPDRPTLVNLDALLRDAVERAGRELDDTDLRVGIGLLERVELLVRHADAPVTVGIAVAGSLFKGADPGFDAFCAAAGLGPGRRWDGSLEDLATQTGLSPLAVERRLLTWRDDGRITLRSGARTPVLERLRAPADTPARMAAMLADYEKAQYARIEQLFEYTGGDRCRHQLLAGHLGHDIAACGDHCDNCKSGRAHATAPRATAIEQAAELETLLARLRSDRERLRSMALTVKAAVAVVDCVASLPYSVTKTAVAKVLSGRDDALFTAAQVRGYGALQDLDRREVPRLVDALVDLGYLAADSRTGQRLISLGSGAASSGPGTQAPGEPVAQARRAFARYASGDEEPWESPLTELHPAAAGDLAADDPPLPANPAQIMLECVASLPFPMGRTGIAKVLAGSGSAAVEADRCRHFGALGMCAQTAIAEGLRVLTEAGFLRQETRETYPLLVVTPKGQSETPPADLVRLAYKAGIGPDARQRQAEREIWRRQAYESASHLADGTLPAALPDTADRFERLRLWRRSTAQREGVPPFMIFHDRVLEAMAERPVATRDDLLALRGVGRIAVDKYGPELLAILRPESDEPTVEPPLP